MASKRAQSHLWCGSTRRHLDKTKVAKPCATPKGLNARDCQLGSLHRDRNTGELESVTSLHVGCQRSKACININSSVLVLCGCSSCGQTPCQSAMDAPGGPAPEWGARSALRLLEGAIESSRCVHNPPQALDTATTRNKCCCIHLQELHCHPPVLADLSQPPSRSPSLFASAQPHAHGDGGEAHG
jgi:hypothetical protein